MGTVIRNDINLAFQLGDEDRNQLQTQCGGRVNVKIIG